MGRKIAPVNVIFHYPTTEEGKRELADNVAKIHADMVIQYIKKLNCPFEQKIKLLDAVIETATMEMEEEKGEHTF